MQKKEEGICGIEQQMIENEPRKAYKELIQ